MKDYQKLNTVLELIEYMNIPPEMVKVSKTLPNLTVVLQCVRSGKVERAKQLYDLYQSKKVLYLTRPEIKKRQNKLRNEKTKRKYGSNWHQNKKPLRDKLYNNQEGLCNVCKQPFIKIKLEIDHIQKLSDGGLHEIENMQLLCANCHDKKDNYPKGTMFDGLHHVL